MVNTRKLYPTDGQLEGNVSGVNDLTAASVNFTIKWQPKIGILCRQSNCNRHLWPHSDIPWTDMTTGDDKWVISLTLLNWFPQWTDIWLISFFGADDHCVICLKMSVHPLNKNTMASLAVEPWYGAICTMGVIDCSEQQSGWLNEAVFNYTAIKWSHLSTGRSIRPSRRWPAVGPVWSMKCLLCDSSVWSEKPSSLSQG